jgi:hypothetical protein
MTRYQRDNQVAVLTNPRWGWWLKHQDWNMVFNPVYVALVLNDQKEQLKAMVPAEYKRLVDELEIEWLDEGTKFCIEDYRGMEMVTVLIRGHSPTTGSELDLDKEWIEA